MSPDFDPYRILSVGRAVSPEQLKTAFRQRSRLAHPEFGGSAAKLAEVGLAFEVLADPGKRNAYDQYLLNPADPAVAARWQEAWLAAQSVAASQAPESFGSEVDQLAAKLGQSHAVRVTSGALLGLLIGAGVGLLGAYLTHVGMPMAIAIGGGIGLLGGTWAAASNSA
ncbi:J domain-containing protein [Humisphaera borealis]|uniref:DnaJ domain-containing protein n=1 Tax=Humisphaera borealis TaxID=2807512 RepID=A0A7M2WWI4_9BACT|nr:DnaJ domain-containing protein [Humisphaera borealis]QOV88870.1 DnaJ domain-containing protein [Humisphaera borealis]